MGFCKVKFHIIPIAFSKADILYGNTMGSFDFSPISLPYDSEIIDGTARVRNVEGK